MRELDTEDTVSKRFQITLPDTIYEQLEAWAKREGRPVANLTSFIVETAVRESEGKQIETRRKEK